MAQPVLPGAVKTLAGLAASFPLLLAARMLHGMAAAGSSVLVMAIVRTPFPRTADVSGPYPMVQLGQALLGDFLVPFELASVLLLVVMIGAAYLAKARRREQGTKGDRAEAIASAARLSAHAKQWS